MKIYIMNQSKDQIYPFLDNYKMWISEKTEDQFELMANSNYLGTFSTLKKAKHVMKMFIENITSNHEYANDNKEIVAIIPLQCTVFEIPQNEEVK